MLPVFAKEILFVGPVGLGWLRAAQSFGAVLVSIGLAHRPPFRRAGRTLLASVAGFGVAIVIFGLSRNYFLSIAMLFVMLIWQFKMPLPPFSEPLHCVTEVTRSGDGTPSA